MTKIAAIKTTRDEKVRQAKRTFYISLLDLSWRLLAAMLLPIFLGLYLDSHFSEGKVFSYIGFILGMIGGALVLRSVVRKLSKDV